MLPSQRGKGVDGWPEQYIPPIIEKAMPNLVPDRLHPEL